MRAFEYTKKVINASFPSENVRVILFGSVANGLAVKSSNDIDVSVECQISDGEKGEEEKASYIESIGCRHVSANTYGMSRMRCKFLSFYDLL